MYVRWGEWEGGCVDYWVVVVVVEGGRVGGGGKGGGVFEGSGEGWVNIVFVVVVYFIF